MNFPSVVAAVLALVSIVFLVVSVRRGPPYGSTLAWVTAGVMALSVAAIWWFREQADLTAYPFGLFCFATGYYVGAHVQQMIRERASA